MITALILAGQNIEPSKGVWQNSTKLSNVFQNATSLQNITNRLNQEQKQNTDLPMLLHEHNIYPLQEKKDETVSTDSNVSNLNELKTLQIIAGGRTLTSAEGPEVHWHVGIYSKAFEPYMQICGGTLVTTKAVISAAHCFWSELDGGALPAAQFAAAAGKLYRPWKESHDSNAQHTDISAIHLPARFRGAITSFQDDIAALLLAKEFVTTFRVRPLCVLFDEDLEADFLRSENEGMIVGWGLTSEDGTPAQTLQSLYMPYVPIEECIASADPGFLKYITSDKICAGVTSGKSLCRGDSGGGLVFNSDLVFIDSEEPRPILYGVASTAPRNAHSCNTHARATLTRVLAHRTFLLAHIPDIEDACPHGSRRIFKPELNRSREESKQGREETKPVFNCNCFCNCNNSTIP
ncbi:modular serine protease-like [Cydia splendana]|uniref:modular serine protease-like n=1 Tax=Cydia splendana TaxID=1100963 RepID=UPI00300DB8C0